jgi:hypothetical protein
MSSPSSTIFFAPLRVPVVDQNTGLMSRDWYLFFQAMFLRIGGTNGQSNDDLLQGIPEELGAAELIANQLTATDGLAQALADVSSMRDQLAELTKRVNDIQQGTML